MDSTGLMYTMFLALLILVAALAFDVMRDGIRCDTMRAVNQVERVAVLNTRRTEYAMRGASASEISALLREHDNRRDRRHIKPVRIPMLESEAHMQQMQDENGYVFGGSSSALPGQQVIVFYIVPEGAS